MLIMAVLLLTLLFLTTTILSLAENINIDCGASESDVRSWVGDEGFIITTGKSLTFKIPGEKNKPFRSLRSFPSDQVNCYGNIPATRGRKTLVRTVFYYGNYDGKSSPPSFSVIYDLKHIDNVTFSTVSSPSDVDQSVFISEVIFSPERENISVCLFRTSPLDVPFISSIEVYVMDAGMYDDIGPNEGLLLRRRSAFGAKEAISDPYGRVWFPIRPNNPVSSELINTSPSSIDTTDVPNKPPAIVMSKALLKNAIKLSDKTLAGSSLYLALYFSEPQSLGHTKKRSFNVFFDTKQLSSVPIVPVFGKATQFVIRDIVATSTSQLIFQSTSDSDLPPIVNAIELHSILKARHIGANIGGQRGGGNEGEEEQSGGGDGPEVMRKQLDGVPPRKPKLPLILGVTLGSAFAAVSSVFAAIFCKRSQNAKPQSNTEPAMSTGAGEEAGVAPLVGQQLASDASHPGKR